MPRCVYGEIYMKKHELQTAFSTRQYMISKDFEIYYYKDTRLSSVNVHTHNYYEFYFFMEGNVDILINDKIYPVQPGDVILIPPETAHRPIIKNYDVPYRRFVLWISRDYCNKLAEASTDYIYMMQKVTVTKEYIMHNSEIEFNTIQSMIFQLIEEIKNDRFGKTAQVSLQINMLILYLNRLLYSRNNPTMPDSGKKLYLRICDYIESNFESEVSLDDIANTFFVSKYHAAHDFKDNMGISIHKYILKKRLNACKNAFLSGKTVTDACKQYGFYDYSAFYRAFKKEYGISPKEYAAKYTKNNYTE